MKCNDGYLIFGAGILSKLLLMALKACLQRLYVYHRGMKLLFYIVNVELNKKKKRPDTRFDVSQS